MKEIFEKLWVGAALAIISGLIGWVIADYQRPNLHLLIDPSRTYDQHRVTMFRLINYGTEAATDSEIRFSSAIDSDAIILLGATPEASIDGVSPSIRKEKLKPRDRITFYLKEDVDSTANPKDLITGLYTDKGKVRISTFEERLDDFTENNQIKSFALGFFTGVIFLMLALLLDKIWLHPKREKSKEQDTGDASNQTRISAKE